ncbi:MAG: ATP-binding cassette domain-containing protein, partial [Rhodospirillaceae bacterium]|nr:ATP-binding cassette domain-containing protein [Rhodospirillaceae bacterium]
GGPPIVSDISVRVQRGDRIGLIGPNGAGKTTLLRLLTGDLAPDQGTIVLGTNLQMVSLDQRRQSLDPEATLSDVLTDGRGETVSVGGKPRHVIGYMKDFLFSPEQAHTPVSALSGGERGRLMLARALAYPSNLLVLDEPTNDLDLETLDLLQEMLSDYAGTVLLVSHDRDFLDRVVTSVIASEGNGRWLEYAGGYSDMISQRGADLTRETRVTGARKKSAPPKSAETVPRKKRRLSFKEKHALEKLPGRIDALQEEIMSLSDTLADPALYGSDPARFQSTSDKLQDVQVSLAAAEEEWLALEMLREELEDC